MIRTFLAVPITGSRELQRFCRELEYLGLAIKPVPKHHWHVTLAFWGKTDPEIITPCAEQIAKALDHFHQFDVHVSGLGAFPNFQRPRTLWADLDAEEQWQELVSQVNHQLSQFGFEPEQRKFHPHLTIARIKRKPPAAYNELVDRHREIFWSEQSVSQILWYQSELTSQGPNYTALKTIHIGKSSN